MAVSYKYTGKVQLLQFLKIKLFCHLGALINLHLSTMFMQAIMGYVCEMRCWTALPFNSLMKARLKHLIKVVALICGI